MTNYIYFTDTDKDEVLFKTCNKMGKGKVIRKSWTDNETKSLEQYFKNDIKKGNIPFRNSELT